MKIRPCVREDAAAISAIYNYYITNSVITFEDVPVDAVEMWHRMENYTKSYPWYVCEVDGHVVGYAYATRWKDRAAYRHSVEISVYVDKNSARQGCGKALYAKLIATLLDSGCHAIIGGVALPNDASVGLHEYFGFSKIAHFPEVGFKFGRWVDVGYWQKTAGTTSFGK
jgi:phosphinothricin acetyltransferase